MSVRHLRIYYFDDFGQEIDFAPISSAVLPATRMPFSRNLCARDYCTLTHVLRRTFAARLAIQQARRKEPYFWAVFVVVCPNRAHAAYRSKRAKTPGITLRLSPGNAYLGSYAAISPLGKIVAGDIMEARLRQALTKAKENIRDVMMRKPGETDRRFLLRG